VWCDDPQEDPVISVFAGCLANYDRALESAAEYVSAYSPEFSGNYTASPALSGWDVESDAPKLSRDDTTLPDLYSTPDYSPEDELVSSCFLRVPGVRQPCRQRPSGLRAVYDLAQEVVGQIRHGRLFAQTPVQAHGEHHVVVWLACAAAVAGDATDKRLWFARKL
jgi:hypothetical protein